MVPTDLLKTNKNISQTLDQCILTVWDVRDQWMDPFDTHNFVKYSVVAFFASFRSKSTDACEMWMLGWGESHIENMPANVMALMMTNERYDEVPKPQQVFHVLLLLLW